MFSSDPSATGSSGQRRKTALVLLTVFITLLMALVFSQAAFNLTPFLQPDTNAQTLLFAAMSAMIFLLLVALTFILLRNLLKLYAERQVGRLGSKFRTKMVLGALLLSITPVIFLFIGLYGLMNRSIDKWFSRPVEEVRQDTAEVTSLLTTYASNGVRAQVSEIASSPDTVRSFETGNFSGVVGEFRRHETWLEGGFALALVDDHAMAAFRAPEPWSSLKQKIGERSTLSDPRVVELNGLSFMIAEARVGTAGRIIVAKPLPEKWAPTLRQIEESQRRYLALATQRKQIRSFYMSLLLLLTVLVLFVSTWFALLLSKVVTRPVEALAEATQAISAGRLDYRVTVAATADELGELVESFNRMAADMESSHLQIASSSRDLADANVQLEQRRTHIETILESIPTGVLSLDAARRVTHTNGAFQRIFQRESGQGAPLRELFDAEVVQDLEHMMRKADRMGSASAQIEVAAQRSKLTLAVTVASLRTERGAPRIGYVIVFEDLTDLLKAQKQSAWREVARRVAHEIKNPLTPIALSAERIRRHLDRGSVPDDASIAVIRGCAETIGGAVDTVRTLVDEFSSLARFPAAEPRPADVNEVVENALALFDGRLDGVRVVRHLSSPLPKVLADPEAIKRAVANLVDNAAEAMQESLIREIHVSTALLPARDIVEIVVADTGHGVTREVKEKLFLPYFSTKKRGTGLGLAIVSRIIEDHHGTIRVEENSPIGARFIVELPVAASEPAAQTA